MQGGQASPVNAGEGQALQEELAKVLEHLTSAARRAVARIAQSWEQENKGQKPPQPENTKDDLRISAGRRVIYGETARGFRNELTPEVLQTLAQAIQQPVTEGARLEDYENRVPRFEIKMGDAVLFRQERDGVVTANELRLERQVEQQAEVEIRQTQPLTEQEASAAELATQQSAQEVQPALDNQDLSLDSDGDGLTNQEERTLGTDPLSADTDRDGLSDAQEIVSGTDPLDLDTDNDGIGDRADHLNGSSPDLSNNSDDLYQGFKQLLDNVYGSQPNEPNQAVTSNSSPEAALTENSASKPASAAAKEIPPAIRVANSEVEKVPEGNAKQLFKALLSELGKETQKLGKQALDWAATRPEWMRDQGVAATALKLFNDNYNKTGETTYQAENYQVKLQGLNNYQISDLNGKSLMEFQQTALGGIKLRGENHMVAPDYQQFANARQSLQQFGKDILSEDSSRRVSLLRGLAPRGDLEITNTLKTKEVMKTAKSFLQNMGVERWDAGEKGNYNIERQGNGYLRIDSKADGRGTVLMIANGQMLTNNLDSKDFTHFRKLDQVMQKDIQAKQEKITAKEPSISHKQQVQKRPSPKKEVGLEL